MIDALLAATEAGLGYTAIAFGIAALVITLTPYRRGDEATGYIVLGIACAMIAATVGSLR